MARNKPLKLIAAEIIKKSADSTVKQADISLKQAEIRLKLADILKYVEESANSQKHPPP